MDKDLEDLLKAIGVLFAGKIILDALKKYRCPRCNYPVEKNNVNCPNCGQPLYWGRGGYG